MGRRLLIGLAVITLLCLSGITGVGASAEPPPNRQYRVEGPATAQQRSAVARVGAAIDEVAATSVVVTASETEVAEIKKLGYTVTVLPRPLAPALPQPQDFPPADSGYHNYAEMIAEVNQVVADHPTIARRSAIGSSYEGRDLIGVKISDNVATDEDEPEVLFTHHQHAREHLTVEMALYLLNLLTDDYGTDPPITEPGRQPRDLDRPRPEPGRRRVRHRHRLLPLLAQEPPAQRRLVRRRHRPEPQLGLQLGLLRRLVSGTPSSETYRGAVGRLGARDRGGARLRQQPRGRRRAADQGRTSTSTPTASWSCGPTATPSPTPAPA